ncbi:MAG TPA: imidazole glycerol phosphate synthase subunit HisH [Flavihumibacter sp.]|nr:imidazole glycerol phosphate synthase subunit HisH [Bacteroidota bacterium]HOA38086.1 imidazole glycerol phosphate synthase subunit HisH [Flavihumibacter sp.]HPZ88167.1 imidazole glycerol phosphate synthase subunit HisH [Flavihumibacter sp.]HQD09559.1 imidazole glycerol phosphate synthase subunit HisH [Flavihumibacter sp.]
MKLAIVKYNAGNIQSVLYALERIGYEAVVTDDSAVLQSADKVIFPGVGEARSAMDYLCARGLDAVIQSLTQPVLGICLGMQLMCSWSEENDTECLGIFGEKVKRFRPEKPVLPVSTDPLAVLTSGPFTDSLAPVAEIPGTALKVPQIGWNTIHSLKTSLFDGVTNNSYCYFVHGYYAAQGQHTIAVTDYVLPYSSALHKGNFYGVQFHPEKSAGVGEQILRNFIEKI